ncbi:MAG TPA: hypothetical protein VF267_04770 [Gammaproteobacteria bacterium]
MFAFALAFNLLVFLLACVGMMVVFMGGTGYLPALLVLLALSLPVTFGMLIAGIAWFAHRHGVSGAAGAIWRSVPQWLTVSFALGVALIFCGELALLVALQLTGTAPGFWQHLPLLAGIGAAIAYCVVHAVREARTRTHITAG